MFHVAGTNGKGSTVAFLRAALEASGHKVHAFTSPHLVRFNERIRDRRAADRGRGACRVLTEVIDAGAGIEPSFFEVATVAALSRLRADAGRRVHPGSGLGGRLDATNVIEHPLVPGSPTSRSITSSSSARPPRHRGRESRRSPSAACRWSRSSTHRRSPAGSRRSPRARRDLASARRRVGRDRAAGEASLP